MAELAPFRIKISNVRWHDFVPQEQLNQGPADYASEVETTGVFYLKRDVLDQMPNYFQTISLLRDTDPGAYELYSHLGCSLLPPAALFYVSDVQKYTSADTLPSFGAVVFPESDRQAHSDRLAPRMVYYTKLTNSSLLPNVEATHGVCCRVVMIYAEQKADKALAAMVYHVAIETNGVRVLKERTTELASFRSNDVHGGRKLKQVKRFEWTYPESVKLFQDSASGRKTIDEACRHAVFVFNLVANIAPRQEIAYQVRCRKHGQPMALFNVAEGRTPYFFKDRELTVNENGRTKKIFHYVPEYTRSNGTVVRAHTKGLRFFQWNGLAVTIGRPGFDFPDIRKFTAPAIDHAASAPVDDGMIEVDKMSKIMLQNILLGNLFRRKRKAGRRR